MKLLSLRMAKRNGCWLSTWFIDGEPFCFGLCPADGRQTQPGIYPVRMVMSPKWSPLFDDQPMPWIDTDPTTDDYAKTTEHRLIHWLNILDQTDGCEGVGYTQSLAPLGMSHNGKYIYRNESIQSSKDCFRALYSRIAPAIDSPEGVTIEIREVKIC